MALTLTFPEGGVLVTGGTGTIGAGIARAFAEAGVPVVFTYKSNAEKARALEAELREQGFEARAHRMDAADGASVEAALDFAESAYGRVHSVACGSGTPVPFDRLMDFPPAMVEEFLNDDALGYYRIFRAAVPRMRAAGGGSLTTCTTLALNRHLDFDALSAFSKGAVDQLVKHVAAEEARHHVRCNAVRIGWVTPLSYEDFRAEIPAGVADPRGNEERLHCLVDRMYQWARLKHIASPIEAGRIFAFFASNEASFLTGQSLTLDGGMTL